MNEPHFVIDAGPDAGRTIPLREGADLLMGRHQDAAYQLNDPRVSRFHCQVLRQGDRVTVIDHGGSGGVLVNGIKVERKPLKHGDTVQVGETLLRFHDHAATEATTVRKLAAGAERDPEAVEGLAELVGQSVGHYRIDKVLGKGESSMVFRATDEEDGKAVALKVMEPAFSADDEERQRFVRAMKTMLPLKHPNLVTLYTAGKTGPYCWVAMELVEGESLTDVIKRIGVAGMLDWKHAWRVGVHVGRALDYAASHGVIHRNITPANILIRGEDKVVKLGDLMLAKALEGTLAQQVTKPGELVGDANYMSPERTAGSSTKVDGRSDIFSLGATLYALLTGKPPFAGATLVETVTKIRSAEPIKPTTFQMGIPSAFEGVVLKMLAKQPDARFQTAGEVVKELERIGKFNGVTA